MFFVVQRGPVCLHLPKVQLTPYQMKEIFINNAIFLDITYVVVVVVPYNVYILNHSPLLIKKTFGNASMYWLVKLLLHKTNQKNFRCIQIFCTRKIVVSLAQGMYKNRVKNDRNFFEIPALLSCEQRNPVFCWISSFTR